MGCPQVDPCEDPSQDVCKGKGTCVYQPKECVAGPDCPHFICQANEFDCHPNDDWSVASAEKKRWCCAVHRMGCPQVDPCEDPSQDVCKGKGTCVYQPKECVAGPDC
eukprot:404140_1